MIHIWYSKNKTLFYRLLRSVNWIKKMQYIPLSALWLYKLTHSVSLLVHGTDLVGRKGHCFGPKLSSRCKSSLQNVWGVTTVAFLHKTLHVFWYFRMRHWPQVQVPVQSFWIVLVILRGIVFRWQCHSGTMKWDIFYTCREQWVNGLLYV